MLTVTLDRSNLANSLDSSGGVKVWLILAISHMAKISASPFFAMSVGRPPALLGHTPLMAKKLMQVPWYAREWRKQAGLNLETAAERSGLSVGYLSDLEKGRKRWSEYHLAALANAYGCDPEDLLWNPLVGRPIWKILRSLGPEHRERAAQVLEILTKKTGTEG